MCGIFAAINNSSVTDHLIHGLSALSYRGYDSAGIAVIANGALNRARCEGKLTNLQAHLAQNPLDGSIGIAHTRWATHGLPNEKNAHPHMTQRVAVVHNGIVENAQSLRSYLESKGHRFESETDSESIAQLITYYLDQGFDEELSIRTALNQIEGSYGVVVMFRDNKDKLYAAKLASPLVVGKSNETVYVSSDENALVDLADEVLHLKDDELVKIELNNIVVQDADGEAIDFEFVPASRAENASQKGDYQHYMMKEIDEQPEVFKRCWHHYYDRVNKSFAMPSLPLPLENVSRLTIIACGTSYYAGMVAKQWLESECGMPVDLEIASEYRYRNAPIVGNSVAIFISQSGETADTLAALKYAKSLGQPTIALVNVINSSMAKEADLALPSLAGPEIGVASTKAFVSQLTSLLCLSICFAKANKRLNKDAEIELIHEMENFSHTLTSTIKNTSDVIRVAKSLQEKNNALYLGRGVSWALANEGSLKLKEISYIHAEAYAAGELKHGPLALVDENMPVVVIAPPDQLTGKTLSNLREVASRGGKVVLISNKDNIKEYSAFIADSIEMPESHPLLQAILYAIPLQLIAYHTALLRGNDVDQPRNLAKSVTVE